MASIKIMEPERLFFTADTHFYHEGMLEHTERAFDFSTVEEMNERLIESWNKTIGPRDIVYHLGDFALANQQKTAAILSRLNGVKHLILGNHDKSAEKMFGKGKFETIKLYQRLRVKCPDAEGEWQDICLMHYPLARWEKKAYGAWMLHGHSHGSYYCPELSSKILDVGVDSVAGDRYTWKVEDIYAPISYATVKEMMTSQVGLTKGL